MSENTNLITVIEPRSHTYREGHSHAARIRKCRDRIYYTVIRRCKFDDTHRPSSVRVYSDTLGSDGLKAVFNGISNHCMECGAIS